MTTQHYYYALDHIEKNEDELDPISIGMLRLIAQLDDLNAWEWNLRLVGIATAVSLALIRALFGKTLGVDWYALVHACISAGGSIICVYLNVFASETLTGASEPLRSVMCGGPLTSLHRVLPSITMGYALLDILDGFSIGMDFILHGLATFGIMAFFCEVHAEAIITPMLLMEASTPFLTLTKATFFNSTITAINQGLFVFTFFLVRGVIAPYLWGQIMMAMYTQSSTKLYQDCYPVALFPISFFTGIFYHILNAYWFYKIVRKVRRKLMGIEGVKAKNDLKDE